jgi:hypothetical protein
MMSNGNNETHSKVPGEHTILYWMTCWRTLPRLSSLQNATQIAELLWCTDVEFNMSEIFCHEGILKFKFLKITIFWYWVAKVSI